MASQGRGRAEALDVVKLVLLQLRGSKLFFCSVILLIVLALLSVWGWSYPVWVFFVLEVTASMAFSALITGVHFRKAHSLGASIGEVRVMGLGNIAYNVDAGCPERALIAEAPYKASHQHIVVILWLVVTATPIPFVPTPAGVAFATLSLLPPMLLTSMLCTLRTLKKPGGLCNRLASQLESHSDIAEILECLHLRTGRKAGASG